MQIAGVGAAGEPEDNLEAHQVPGHSRAHACTRCLPGSAQRSAACHISVCQAKCKCAAAAKKLCRCNLMTEIGSCNQSVIAMLSAICW